MPVKGTVVPASCETVVAVGAAAEEGAAEGVATAPEAATTAGAGAAFPPLKASTSSAVTRPAGPEPGTLARSTPSCEASFLA